MKHADQSVYDGEWFRNEKNGFGTYSYSNGDRYVFDHARTLCTGPQKPITSSSTLWVFWNKSTLRADLRVFPRGGCRGLG
jgi:hypothetical protein